MIDKKKELNNNIKEMLKEWGISEAFYVKVREASSLNNEEYDNLALEYNAPLGKSWGAMQLMYQEIDGQAKIDEGNFHKVCAWAISISQVFMKEDDEAFFKQIASKTFDQFYKSDISYKESFFKRVKRQSVHMDCLDNQDLLDIEELNILNDTHIKSVIGRNLKDNEKMQGYLSKKDYPTNWECALDIRKKIVTGDGLSKDMEIFAGYDWAIKNCNVKGEPIEHRNKLINGYDNAKNKTRSAIIIGKFEEDYYD